MDSSHQLIKCHQRLLKSRLRPLDPRSAPLTSLHFFFLPGLFLFVDFIILDVFCLLVRLSSRLRATVGRQTDETSCQNFESVARRKGPAVFRIRSTWSRRIVGKPFFFFFSPSIRHGRVFVGGASRQKTLPCPRRPTLQRTSLSALEKYLQSLTAAVVVMHFQTSLFHTDGKKMIFYDNKLNENTHHNDQAGCPSQEPLGTLTLAIAVEGARYIFFGSESTVSSVSVSSHL